jgi:Rieske Fe-S protein
MLQPPYSLYLAPCDLFLFKKVETAVKGHHFESTEHIQRSVKQDLNDIPQNTFQECYNGSTAGNDVCRHKGCTVKVTTL